MQKYQLVVLICLTLLSTQPLNASDKDASVSLSKCSEDSKHIDVMCPAVFEPVCGLDSIGQATLKFSNSCQACSSGQIDFYQSGECPTQTIEPGQSSPTNYFIHCSDPRPQICPLEYVSTCGLFMDTIQCIIAPCGNQYNNGCLACADEMVEKYFTGDCSEEANFSEPPNSLGPILLPPQTKPEEKYFTYCPKERSDLCTEEFVNTCGLFGPKVQCIKAPCGQQYSNGCNACTDVKVEKYFAGECSDFENVQEPATQIPNECPPKNADSEFAICPAQYAPVCMYGNDGIALGTASNSCEACRLIDTQVYVQGECQDMAGQFQDQTTVQYYACEDRPQSCDDVVKETCGLLTEDTQCQDITCAQNFSNECQACMNSDVVKYFFGKCNEASSSSSQASNAIITLALGTIVSMIIVY